MHSLKVNSKGSHDRRWLRPPGSSSQTRQAAGLCKPPSSRPTPPGLVLWPLHTPSLVSCDFILVLSVERGHGVPSLHLCFPICAWGPGDQAVFRLGRLEVASLHSAARFACLPHSTLPLGLALPWPCSPSPCCPRTWLPFLREFVGVRGRSPVHPRCVPARCPPRGSLWPWICLREIRLHIPVCGAPGEMLAQ